MNQESLLSPPKVLGTELWEARVSMEFRVGRFLVKTLSTSDELMSAFTLRYQVFQVEMIGKEQLYGIDHDSFDLSADHLGIFDEKSNKMIATCRLNSSLFTDRFYSEQEFSCRSLLDRPECKLEIGRVCVDRDFRKGAIILILWRAIAEYMVKTKAEILFGCGSVSTLDARETLVLYRYLEREGKLKLNSGVQPLEHYRFGEFEKLLLDDGDRPLSLVEKVAAEALIPPLCKSYFDIGCYAAGKPAVDYEFKCIDFLTVLELKTLDPKIRKKMFGN